MLGALTILAMVLAAPPGSASAPVVAPGEFRAWFDAACANTLEMPTAVERSARRYRYVFVAGFYNERMGGYFAQNAKELRALGVPRRQIHYITPSSHATTVGNIDSVSDEFARIAREGLEPLVVIAHSRGACDALAFALQNPAFVAERVEALFLVQGPFGGTGLADYVAGDGPPMDERMPLRLRLLAHLAVGLEKFMLWRGKHGGLDGMTHQGSHSFWERTLKEHADAIPIVGPKTFYITGEASSARLWLFRRAAAVYLGAHFGPNDGVVALRDQSLSALGTVLAVVDAGHADLTSRFPWARQPRRFRKALIQSIVMAVGQPSADKASAGPIRLRLSRLLERRR